MFSPWKRNLPVQSAVSPDWTSKTAVEFWNHVESGPGFSSGMIVVQETHNCWRPQKITKLTPHFYVLSEQKPEPKCLKQHYKRCSSHLLSIYAIVLVCNETSGRASLCLLRRAWSLFIFRDLRESYILQIYNCFNCENSRQMNNDGQIFVRGLLPAHGFWQFCLCQTSQEWQLPPLQQVSQHCQPWGSSERKSWHFPPIWLSQRQYFSK